MTLVTTCL